MSKYRIFAGKFGNLSTIEKDGQTMLDVVAVDLQLHVDKPTTMVITTIPESVDVLVDEDVYVEEGQQPHAS
jgi:hypothetical protein